MSYSWGAARNPRATERPWLTERAWPARTDDLAAAAGDAVQMRRLAAELAPMVQVWKRLIIQHTPNRSGRCRTCTSGGTGLPPPWPCPLYGIAELARRSHDQDLRGA